MINSFQMLKLKPTLRFLVLYSAFTLILLTFLSILPENTKHNPMYAGSFTDTDPAWADTALKYMNIEQKIGQLLIAKYNIQNKQDVRVLINIAEKNNIGGFYTKADSLSLLYSLKLKTDTSLKVPPLHIMKARDISQIIFPGKNFPSPIHAAAIRKDSLRKSYFEKISNLSQAIGINAHILPQMPLSEEDSLQKLFYIKYLSQYANSLSDKNMIPVLETEQFFKQDSSNFQNNRELFSQILGYKETAGSEKKSDPPYAFNFELKKRYNYKGLIIKSSNPDSVNAVLKQFQEGTHCFVSESPKQLMSIFKYLLKENKISEKQINARVRTVLLAKTYAGLPEKLYMPLDSFSRNTKNKVWEVFKRKIYKQSFCLLKNKKSLLPYSSVYNTHYVTVDASCGDYSAFLEAFSYFMPSKHIKLEAGDTSSLNILKNYNEKYHAIVLIDSTAENSYLKKLKSKLNSRTITLVNFKNRNNPRHLSNFESVLHVWSDSKLEQKYAAEALWGGIAINGQWPFAEKNIAFSTGIIIPKTRVAPALPEETGLNSERLNLIDSIANSGIRLGAYPGCQVMVLKNGFEVFHKTYGYHTYAKRQRVKTYDIYDLASVTKIAATTTAFMHLYDRGKIKLNDRIGKFFKDKSIDYSNLKPDTIINIDTLLFSETNEFEKILKHQDTLHLNDSAFIAFDTILVRTTPKNNIFKVKTKNLLLHKSGVRPVLPILPYLMYKKIYFDSLAENESVGHTDSIFINTDSIQNINHKDSLKKIFDKYFTRKYIKDSSEIRIAENLYFRNNYFDTLWKNTKRLSVYSRKIYQYSDMNMILLQLTLDSLTDSNMDKYLKKNISRPMGLKSMSYKPYKYFSKQRIVPTENDKYWREQLLRGDVHDPSAAMLGGISGNAGLFSNAKDLAVLGQMWLNGGSYGSRQYISEESLKKFTQRQTDSHRGLGFDKACKRCIVASEAPSETYGHTGFTGTCIWVDPVNEIVFVFLSNRVHPKQKNWRINKYRIRQNIHSAIYKAMESKKAKP